jgi:hypothetical protein
MKRVASAALVLLAPLWGPGAAHAQGASGGRVLKSVLDSVYTAEQAREGKALFDQLCLRCHAAPDFASERFKAKWTARSLHELYAALSRTMPFDQPGSLRPPQYIELLAFLLSVNGYPAGGRELRWDLGELAGIKIDPPPGRAPESRRP